jgi:hypothetical protein
MVELDYARHSPHQLATATQRHDLIALADLFDGQVKQRHTRHARSAQQAKFLPMRQHEHAPRLEHDLLTVHLGHALPLGDNDEHHRLDQPRHIHAPGRRHGRPAIERPREAQHMQHLAQRVGKRRRLKAIHGNTVSLDDLQITADFA